MQSTWSADAWELIKKLFVRWQAIGGAILTVVSFVQFVPNITEYIPQANTLGLIIFFAGVAAIFIALVDVYREQKLKSNNLPRLIIKPSSPTISAQGGWHRTCHEGDLVIRANLDIRNSGTTPIIFGIAIASINYNGALFETTYKKANIRLPQPSGRRGQPISQKFEIGAEVRWSDCTLEVVVPQKFNSVEDFFAAMLTQDEKKYELILTVDAETLEGEKLSNDPLYLKGDDLSQILDEASNRWQTLLTHPQNLKDQERHSLVVALLDAVKTYYQYLSKA